VQYGMASDRRRGTGYTDGDKAERGTGTEPGAGRSETRMMKVLPLRYSINENRIMNSGDTRYFDHPKFGVIARVNRIETPEPLTGPDGGDDTDVLLPVGNQ